MNLWAWRSGLWAANGQASVLAAMTWGEPTSGLSPAGGHYGRPGELRVARENVEGEGVIQGFGVGLARWETGMLSPKAQEQ